jgi:hypothetical protein
LKADLADQGSSQESAREGCTIAAPDDLWAGRLIQTRFRIHYLVETEKMHSKFDGICRYSSRRFWLLMFHNAPVHTRAAPHSPWSGNFACKNTIHAIKSIKR